MMKTVKGFVLMGALALGLAGCYTVLKHPSVVPEERALAARESTVAEGRQAACTDCHNNEYDHQGSSHLNWGGWGGYYNGYGYTPFGYYSYNPWQRYYYEPWWYNSGWGWGWGGWGGYNSPYPYYPGTPSEPGQPPQERPATRRGQSAPPPTFVPPPPSNQGQEPEQNKEQNNNSNDNQRRGRRGSGK
jgi:hypothetical protein